MLKTIDELLVWLEKSSTQYGAGMDASAREAIRAILEQHREPKPIEFFVRTQAQIEQIKLEAVRAFVERVNWRFSNSESGSVSGLLNAISDELAAMEAEVKND